jgi:elongation factor G
MCFVNKLDKTGGDFHATLKSIRERLTPNAVAAQIPMGAESDLKGMIDLLTMKAYTFSGDMGMEVNVGDVPEEFKSDAKKFRQELIEKISENNEELMDKVLGGEEISLEELKKELRRATIANEIVPVFGGTAFKNIGVQLMLDAVIDFLPSPLDIASIKGIDPKTEEEIERKASDEEPFSGLVFKIATDPFVGQIAFTRIYSGILKSGSYVLNSTTGKKERIGRLLRMHANEREEITEGYAGEIVAIVGLKDSKTSDTLCDLDKPVELHIIIFPETVNSLKIDRVTID